MPPPFNPFTDRLSRDIRNDLSSSLVTCLEEGSLQPAQQVADTFLARGLERNYVAYIETRLDRYRQAIAAISQKVEDPFLRSFILWDLELFFEMHEVLEQEWYHADGEIKQLMQALIRAAGVYIKRECGFDSQAERIAGKALPVLESQRAFLERYITPETLIAALRSGDQDPPRLLAGGSRE